MEKGICQFCGSEFEKTKPNKVFCSANCRAKDFKKKEAEHFIEMQKNRELKSLEQEERKRRLLEDKNFDKAKCKQCSDEFLKTKPSKLFCTPKCRLKYFRENKIQDIVIKKQRKPRRPVYENINLNFDERTYNIIKSYLEKVLNTNIEAFEKNINLSFQDLILFLIYKDFKHAEEFSQVEQELIKLDSNYKFKRQVVLEVKKELCQLCQGHGKAWANVN